jgi:hypothetical protein
VLQTVVDQLADHVQPLTRGDIPVPLLLDLGEEPWLRRRALSASDLKLASAARYTHLDQSTTSDHNAVHSSSLHVLVVSTEVVGVSVAEDGDRSDSLVGGGLAKDLSALCDVCWRRRGQSWSEKDDEKRQTHRRNRPWSCSVADETDRGAAARRRLAEASKGERQVLTVIALRPHSF